jgi:ferredoxin
MQPASAPAPAPRPAPGNPAASTGRAAVPAWRAAPDHPRDGSELAAAPTGWLLTIDWTACDGRGWCVELLPELLTQDRWGYPIPHQDAARATAARDGALGGTRPRGREIAVPAGLAAHARRAADSCPRLALRLRHVP